MPLVKKSTYRPPWWLKNAHLSTILPSIFRKVSDVGYQRERIDTSDGDFIELDWLHNNSSSLLVLVHGLEGSSDRAYMKGVAQYFGERKWDVVAYNCRSCSGTMNLAPRLYHHGDTEDFDEVITHIMANKDYKKIVLVGFSMGGSIILNYLGNGKHKIPREIGGAVAFSVPINIKSSALELNKRGNVFYRRRFIKKLVEKIRTKNKQFPNILDLSGIDKIDNFQEIDERYNAPIHGFESADDFYRKASCGNYLHNINVPSLIVNAANDPFLPNACYPTDIASNHPKVYLEIPTYGGHVGFSNDGLRGSWMEIRAWEFVHEVIYGYL